MSAVAVNPYLRGFLKSKAAVEKKEEDIYEGYGDLANVSERIHSTIAAAMAPTSGGFGPTALAMRPPTGMSYGGGEGGARPMTASSIRGAGYTSAGKRPSASGSSFDPLQQSAQGPAPPLVQKTDNNPEQQARDMELQVNTLIEGSVLASAKGDFAQALEKAKEATKKERFLCKHRDKHGLADQINIDLTYAVRFNLADQYHQSGMLSEALTTYGFVVKNKQYPQAGRLKLNMGNIFYQQKKYPAAIKMYRMAMDHVGSTSKDMRFKIMRNIGNSFIRLGQFQDAMQSFEAIMDASPDSQSAFNLIVCYYALGDNEKMKKGFSMLLQVPEVSGHNEDDDLDAELEAEAFSLPSGSTTTGSGSSSGSGSGSGSGSLTTNEDLALLALDDLRKERVQRQKLHAKYVLTAAKLIAPHIDENIEAGYNWIIELLRTDRRPATPNGGSVQPLTTFPSIAMEMEIAKGVHFLRNQQIPQAIEVFKGLEGMDQGLGQAALGDVVLPHRRDHDRISQAATNLALLYFLEGDMKNTDKFAELAVRSNRYNAKALVNKANHLFAKGDVEGARDIYLEAIGAEADCIEGIYNLGLAQKRLHNFPDAIRAFKKLHHMMPKDPFVIYQIANLYDICGEDRQAIEWFNTLHLVVPSDPKVLARLGMLYSKTDRDQQAFHNYSDSYNLYPATMDVISWLGVWFVKQELYEEAIQYFERASELEPNEVKWQLMVASCWRRMGSYMQALGLYKKIHNKDPDNIECLRYLCTICKDLNDDSYEEYSRLLKKAERAMQQSQQEEDGYNTQDPDYPYNQQQQQPYMSQPPQYGDVSPRSRSPQQTPRKDLHENFNASLSPTRMGPTLGGQGGGRRDDEDWGDDEVDDLLPL